MDIKVNDHSTSWFATDPDTSSKPDSFKKKELSRPLTIPFRDDPVWKSLEEDISLDELLSNNLKRHFAASELFIVISGTLRLINLILTSVGTADEVTTVVGLDKSERNGVVCFVYLWDALKEKGVIPPQLQRPLIRFLNIGYDSPTKQTDSFAIQLLKEKVALHYPHQRGVLIVDDLIDSGATATTAVSVIRQILLGNTVHSASPPSISTVSHFDASPSWSIPSRPTSGQNNGLKGIQSSFEKGNAYRESSDFRKELEVKKRKTLIEKRKRGEIASYPTAAYKKNYEDVVFHEFRESISQLVKQLGQNNFLTVLKKLWQIHHRYETFQIDLSKKGALLIECSKQHELDQDALEDMKFFLDESSPVSRYSKQFLLDDAKEFMYFLIYPAPKEVLEVLNETQNFTLKAMQKRLSEDDFRDLLHSFFRMKGFEERGTYLQSRQSFIQSHSLSSEEISICDYIIKTLQHENQLDQFIHYINYAGGLLAEPLKNLQERQVNRNFRQIWKHAIHSFVETLPDPANPDQAA